MHKKNCSFYCLFHSFSLLRRPLVVASDILVCGVSPYIDSLLLHFDTSTVLIWVHISPLTSSHLHAHEHNLTFCRWFFVTARSSIPLLMTHIPVCLVLTAWSRLHVLISLTLCTLTLTHLCWYVCVISVETCNKSVQTQNFFVNEISSVEGCVYITTCQVLKKQSVPICSLSARDGVSLSEMNQWNYASFWGIIRSVLLNTWQEKLYLIISDKPRTCGRVWNEEAWHWRMIL